MMKQASTISIGTLVTLIVLAVSGGMYVQAIASDVEELEKDVAKQKVAHDKDHDDVVTLKADVQHIKIAADNTAAAVQRIEQMINQNYRGE